MQGSREGNRTSKLSAKNKKKDKLCPKPSRKSKIRIKDTQRSILNHSSSMIQRGKNPLRLNRNRLALKINQKRSLTRLSLARISKKEACLLNKNQLKSY